MYSNVGNLKSLSFVIMLLISLDNIHTEIQSLIIVTEEWAPFNYSDNGEIKGISTDIVRKILEDLKQTYEIILYPSLRAKHILDTIPNAMMFSMYRTPEREGSYKWVGPISDGSIHFYKLKSSNLNITSMDDAKKVTRIACRSEGLIPSLLKELGFINIDRSGTESSNIYSRLLNGWCDLAISDTDVGVQYVFRKIGKDYQLLEKIPLVVFRGQLYIAFNRNIDDTTVEQWQNAYNKLIANGSINEIYEKYR
jgi:polar amino acid transport system substrate-binding protein